MDGQAGDRRQRLPASTLAGLGTAPQVSLYAL